MAKEPRASSAKVAYHLKQLRKLLSRASDQQFLQMVWAIPGFGLLLASDREGTLEIGFRFRRIRLGRF
jgi:hypothetical protein